MSKLSIRRIMAVMAMLIAAPIIWSASAQADTLPNDAGGHIHIAGTVAAWGTCGTVLSGVEGYGHQTNPATYDYVTPEAAATQGNAPDHQWVQDVGATSPIVFDMGVARKSVLLFPSIDHGPIPAEGIEATVYGANAPGGPWTVSGDVSVVFDQGFDAAWISDDYVSQWDFATPYRYIAVGWGGPKAAQADGDAEIDAVCATTDLQPRHVDATIFPGASTEIQKTVVTPVLPPNPDIVFLADTTGSMGPALANVKANVGAIMSSVLAVQSTAQFGAASYKDFNCDLVPYSLDQAVTASTAAVQAGINTWTAGGGCDTPEAQLNALYQLATDPTVGFRTGSSRVIVWFGDASGHDPSNGHSLAQVIGALQAAPGIRVIAVPVTCCGDGLDFTGQATAITAATGGVLLPGGTASQVSSAILAGLQALPITVTMQSDCTPPISTAFSPASQTVVSGSTVTFTETITVAANAPGGTYSCNDRVLVNGIPLTDASGVALVESKTIKVPEGVLTGGGQIDNGNGPKAETISFGGNVGFLADFSIVGQWETNLHNVVGTSLDGGKFHSTSFTLLQFSVVCGPAANPPPANANAAHFSAMGTFNGTPGYTLEVWASDFGEPGKDNDALRFKLFNPANVLVYDSWIGGAPAGDFADNDNKCSPETGDVHRHQLDGGNLQIHSGVKN